ncbi:MAG: carboxynorspermidine decarboxylase [Lentisphaeria bacterium]|nr:carboxynorspermidine decarboxylase [Lentisphaeria bacterium]
MSAPFFLVDEARLETNLRTLFSVKKRTDCKILLALKGFAMWSLAPLIRKYLDGVCASSPWEARLGREEFGGEVHAYAAAYSQEDILSLRETCTEIDFNSLSQWERFRSLVKGRLLCGLRVNPECSTQERPMYDPCAPCSRLGITADTLFNGAAPGGRPAALDGITGLHFHTLCEQDSPALAVTLDAVENRFGSLLSDMDWVNFGGGHHITRADYDIDLLCRLINDFKKKHGVRVYLEPGEAVALNAGVLVAEVLDIIHNGMDIAILNVSCTAHMPDVLEMPYRPNICVKDGDTFFPAEGKRAGQAFEKAHTYRLGGVSCLAGDIIGDYSFDTPLKTGDTLIFEDMAHYSMVKTTMFNGVKHPDIKIRASETGEIRTVRAFTYEDYRDRLS